MRYHRATPIEVGKVFLAFALATWFFVPSAAPSCDPPPDEKTITLTLIPPYQPFPSIGRGCPARLPDGTMTENFTSSLDDGGASFFDPLPSGALLTAIDVTFVGASVSLDGQPATATLWLNPADTFRTPIGTIFPQNSPLSCAGGRVFVDNTVTLRPCTGSANGTIPYHYNDVNRLDMGLSSQDLDIFFRDVEFTTLTITLHYVMDHYALTGQILDGTTLETKNIPPGPALIYAQVPLGLELQLGMKNSVGYVKARYSLSPATLTGLASPTLYPTNAVLEYDRYTAVQQKIFLAVHIGTQTLTIQPVDTTVPPLIVTVGVFDPGNLGNTQIAYDKSFADWGNRRGIPPHILKGLVRKEGPFRPLEYRYEPISPTTGDRYVQTALTDTPFADYRLQTSSAVPALEPFRADVTGLTKGPLLLDLNSGAAYTTVDDLWARKAYQLPRGTNGAPIPIRPLDVCPTLCVSAREIFENNDGSQNWSDPRYVGPVDWWDDAHLKLLEFTAQTPTAASYGLMQVMYVKAKELGWQSSTGARNPSLLFDTAANLAAGDGSIKAGTLGFYWAYRNCTAPDWATDPNFSSSDAYRQQIVAALNWYNHGNANRNPTYGDDAWNYSLAFRPSHPLSLVFP